MAAGDTGNAGGASMLAGDARCSERNACSKLSSMPPKSPKSLTLSPRVDWNMDKNSVGAFGVDRPTDRQTRAIRQDELGRPPRSNVNQTRMLVKAKLDLLELAAAQAYSIDARCVRRRRGDAELQLLGLCGVQRDR